MNILLFGKTGQVGWELQRALAPLGNLIALDVHSTDYCGDFSNPEGVAETVRSIRPDIIVNAAAHTAVDKAESEPKFAQLLNATSVEAIAKAANEVGAWVIHYSTDYVFPGTGEIPWQEEDATAPLNVYGETKLAGEKALQEHCAKHLIFRTSWVYAGKGNNFAKTMLRLAKESCFSKIKSCKEFYSVICRAKKSLYINDCHCNAFGFICILLRKVYFNIVDGG